MVRLAPTKKPADPFTVQRAFGFHIHPPNRDGGGEYWNPNTGSISGFK